MLTFVMSKFDKSISFMYFLSGEINFPLREVRNFKFTPLKRSSIVEKLTFFSYNTVNMKFVSLRVF